MVPCAFMEAFDLKSVYSSIDHHGRYAYGNQPIMARWNLVRLAETLVPLINEDEDKAINLATDVIAEFVSDHKVAWLKQMRAKIGLQTVQEGDEQRIKALFDALTGQGVDFTLFFRALSKAVAGDDRPVAALFSHHDKIIPWLAGWRVRLSVEAKPSEAISEAMDRENPLYIPRNHMVEAALQAAEDEGQMAPFEALLSVISDPFTERDGLEAYARPAPSDFGPYVTFCGT